SDFNAFMIFKKNGNIYSFFKISKNLDDNPFNLEKANIGYLVKERNYSIYSYSTINCGAFSKSEFKVKGDTLMISAGSNIGDRIWYYYIKHEVPKEWLNFETDY
ncbi:MAG: hypothetical protein ACWIPJ_10485, partial [Polaribacter sp.]